MPPPLPPGLVNNNLPTASYSKQQQNNILLTLYLVWKMYNINFVMAINSFSSVKWPGVLVAAKNMTFSLMLNAFVLKQRAI